MSIKNKIKITEIDRALVELQDKVRQSMNTQGKKKLADSQSKLPSLNEKGIPKIEKESEETLNSLDKMQL